MSINDDILSRELKHRALLSLYEKKLDNDLTKVMSSHKKRLVNSTLKNGMKGSNALNRALGIETRKTYRRIYRDALKELKQLAKVDAKFQASTLNKAFGKVYRARVYTGLKVNDLIINSAGTYSQQITSISLAQQRRIKSIVKQGMVDNLAVNKIADNIGRTVDLPQAQLRTLSRTAITETSTTVNKATYKLNEDVLDGYEYVATLDSRTSLICANLDGRVFRLNDPKGIRPPQHFNCRSTTIPIVKSHEDLISTNSNRVSKRRLKRMTQGKRASFNGQVPSKTNFEEFFKQQDNDFKLAVLGTQKRVDIYNTGKLKFSQFSTKDGKLVSISRLDELLNSVKVKPVKKIVKRVSKAVPVEKLFGEDKVRGELRALKEGFGDKPDVYSKLIRSIPAVGKAVNKQNAYYIRRRAKYKPGTFDIISYDEISFGPIKGRSKINRQTTIVHEYAHRLDYRILEDVIKDDEKFKKLIKGFSTDKFVRSQQSKLGTPNAIQLKIANPERHIKNNVFEPKTFSELAADDIALDYKTLRSNSPSRRAIATNRARAAERELKDVVKNPTDTVAINKYYDDLIKKEPNIPGISDDDLMYYLKDARKENYIYTPPTSKDLFEFKVKINERMMLPTGGGKGYDLDFNTKFNDYVGSITRNEIGDGHDLDYYLNRRKIGRLDDDTLLSDSMVKESFAEYVSTMKHPDPIVRKVERKLMEHYAPNTTKAYDTLISRLDKLYD